MTNVEVIVAHNERATVRVGDVFLKIDADQTEHYTTRRCRRGSVQASTHSPRASLVSASGL